MHRVVDKIKHCQNLKWGDVLAKRVFLIVLDSFGIGGAHDAADYGDEGSNTLAAVMQSEEFCVQNLEKLGLFNIQGVKHGVTSLPIQGAFGRLVEKSKGKDTTIGHWELAGVVSETPLPMFPNGFPSDLLQKVQEVIGCKVLCGLPYSGTELLRDYGEEHLKTGYPIVYTSADSVFQIAAHEDVISVEKLYQMCELAREVLKGDWGVGRVIARPFLGDNTSTFKRTARRHDYSLKPPKTTALDVLKENGLDVIAVGKIFDIFAGCGVSKSIKTDGNEMGMKETLRLAKEPFEGLCFVNLVDFDMLYGHRNDVLGYARAVSCFDAWLPQFLSLLQEDDLLMITADHGCDPSTSSTDHSRENVPLLIASPKIKTAIDLGIQQGFGCVGSTVLDYFGLPCTLDGKSMLSILR